MRLQVKGKNVEVSPTMRDYAERKLSKLAKQLADQTQVEVELSEQRNPSIAGATSRKARSSRKDRRCGPRGRRRT